MHKTAEDKIRRLTQNQAKALQALISAPTTSNPVASGTYISNASGLRGNSFGGTVSALERNGTIQPIGREGRQFNWELTDPDLKQAQQKDRETLLAMLKRITKEIK